MAAHYKERGAKDNRKTKRQAACRAEFVWSVFDLGFLAAMFGFLSFFANAIFDGTAIRYCIVRDPFLDGYIKFNCVQNRKYYIEQAVTAVKIEMLAAWAIIFILSLVKMVKL
ncbi:MAG: hypothetical protein MHMPM18_005127, partial [Marteilia pararefringens]